MPLLRLGKSGNSFCGNEQVEPATILEMKLFGSNVYAVCSLLVVNLIPLAGVLFWEWNVFFLLLTYWFESVIVGVFTVLKMKKAQRKYDHQGTQLLINDEAASTTATSFLVGFFTLHYGIFTLVHGIFVGVLFFSSSVSLLAVASMVASLVFSHSVSYQTNFIQGGEYKSITAANLFFAPYKRVLVMHLTVIAGSFWVISSHNQTPALLIMIILKIGTDLASHLWEHRPNSQLQS